MVIVKAIVVCCECDDKELAAFAVPMGWIFNEGVWYCYGCKVSVMTNAELMDELEQGGD